MNCRLIVIPSVVVASMLLVSTAYAVSPHTWVSSWGSDTTGTGAYSNPYLTFAGAAANTSEGGVISCETPGDFGPLTISQAVTIDGVPGASITFTGAEGIYISAGTTDAVTIKDLEINGLGQGEDAIYESQAGFIVIDHCTLHNFTDIGVAIYSANPIDVTVKNCTLDGGNIGQIGVRTFQSPGNVLNDTVTVRDTTISNMASSGIFSRNNNLDVSNCEIKHNYIALECDTSANIAVESSMLTYNQNVTEAYTTGSIFLNNDDMLFNVNGIVADGGTIHSNGNNRKAQNANPGVPNATYNTF